MQTNVRRLHPHDTARRAGYCGVAHPLSPPAPRDPLIISGELRQAGAMLQYYASEIANGVGGGRTLADIDRLLIGVSNLIRELRQRDSHGRA
jgi:hypothetical protein